MNYEQIIKDNCHYHSDIRWWPRFAFHYTDVTNAASILSSGCLYSRIDAVRLNLMYNDNASRQVIDMTKTKATANVRFYFRPLTPTQYYNEGYKHPALRYYDDKNANVPVPIFFVFNLETLLQMPKAQFSEQAQSGYGSHLCNTADEFASFNFDEIYSNKIGANWRDANKYKHAEILYPGKFEIDSCLRNILCRNNAERITLINLLKMQNYDAYRRYSSIIKVCRNDMFYKNGLFIDDCRYHDDTVSISFADTSEKYKYNKSEMNKKNITSLEPVKMRTEIKWIDASGLLCNRMEIESQIDYMNPRPLVITNLPEILGARTIIIMCYFEESLMCCFEESLINGEIIFGL